MSHETKSISELKDRLSQGRVRAARAWNSFEEHSSMVPDVAMTRDAHLADMMARIKSNGIRFDVGNVLHDEAAPNSGLPYHLGRKTEIA